MRPGAANSKSQFRADPRFLAAPTGAPDSSARRSQGGARLSSSQRVADERVRILTRICQAIDYHVGIGRPAAPQFRRFSRQWRGAFFLSAPERPVQLSAETIRRMYYKRWKRSGRQAQALHFRHAGKGPHCILTGAQHRRLHAGLRTVPTLSALYRHVFPAAPRPSATVFFRSFPAEERRVLRIEFARRSAARAAARLFSRWSKQSARSFTPGGRR